MVASGRNLFDEPTLPPQYGTMVNCLNEASCCHSFALACKEAAISYALTRQFHKKSSVLKDYYPYRRGQIGVQGRELGQQD